jgi:hypothetical protein
VQLAEYQRRFGAIAVDPLVIRTVMVRTPAVVEYQVRQTRRGIEVAVVANGCLDHAGSGPPWPKASAQLVYPTQTSGCTTSRRSPGIPKPARPNASSPYDPAGPILGFPAGAGVVVGQAWVRASLMNRPTCSASIRKASWP